MIALIFLEAYFVGGTPVEASDGHYYAKHHAVTFEISASTYYVFAVEQHIGELAMVIGVGLQVYLRRLSKIESDTKPES